MVGSQLRILGSIEYEPDERTRAVPQARHALLLVYLVLEAPASHDRDTLAARFCPEYNHSRATAWLRQALAALSEWAQPRAAGRGAPGWAGTSGLLQPDTATTGWLQITRHTVSVDPTRLAVDALRLMQIHQCITGHPHRQLAGCPVCLPRLAEAAALVRGVPLTGLDAAGNDALEHWIQARRAQFSDMARDIFAALVETRVRMGDHARAIEGARRWLKLEPTSEAVHRLLITALAHRGSRGAALQHVDWFRQLVHSRLGFDLEPATLELERRIREGRLVAPPPRPAPDSRIADPAHTALRDQVVALVNESGQRLVSIVGADGTGRATLARAVAWAAAPLFAAGAAVVSLDTSDDAHLMICIGDALAVPFTHRDAASVQLARALTRHDGLLVIDRLSRRAEIGPLLVWLLERAPRLAIVVATEQRIGLRAEAVIECAGLDSDRASQRFAACANVAMRRLAPREVQAWCSVLGGIPLAIELAAASLEPADLPALSAMLQASAPDDRADRPRWSTALVACVWQRLDAAEQQMLGLLAMFRSAFDAHAALQVAAYPGVGSSLASGDATRVLHALIRRGLIHELLVKQRLQMHPAIRHAVVEHLARGATRLHSAQAAHAARMLGELLVHALRTPNAASRWHARQLAPAFGDLAAAWRWAHETSAWHWIDATAAPLIVVALGNGWCDAVSAMLGAAAAASMLDEAGRARAARLSVLAARLARHVGDDDSAREYRRLACLALPDDASDDLRAQVIAIEALQRRERGDHAGAEALLRPIVLDAAHRRRLHATTDAWIHRMLGQLALARRSFDEATAALRVALNRLRELDDELGTVALLNELATVASVRGDRARALALLDDALLHARALGDPGSLLMTIERTAVLRLQESHDLAGTIAMLEEGLELDQRCGAPERTWHLRAMLVDALARHGAYDAARRAVLTGLAQLDPEEDPWPIAFASAANYEWHVGNDADAAVLWGVAARGAVPQVRYQAETMLRALQLRLGAAHSAQLAARAASLSLRDCVRLIRTRLA